MPEHTYRGRFAPSPTGPLHFGSLVTALASYLEARSRHGCWLVRIEDIDPLRESAEATLQIMHSLDAHGLISDEPIRFQSRNHLAYQTAVDRLLAQGLAYRCTCSRKELQQNQGRHPNHCRNGNLQPEDQPFAVRFALHDEHCTWYDELLGPQYQQVHQELDDPVILRKEGFYAYQLAVVVDDIEQGISDVVRGSDLLEMTAQQQQIYRALGAIPPRWLHVPVIINRDGQKLSKQNCAPALDDNRACQNLIAALEALGQSTPTQPAHATVDGILQWAINHWQRDRLPRHSALPPDSEAGDVL